MDLAPRARSALEGAGGRALALNVFAAAVGFYRAALGLWPPDATEQRAGLLFRLALALGGAGEDDEGVALEQARSALAAVGDRARSPRRRPGSATCGGSRGTGTVLSSI